VLAPAAATAQITTEDDHIVGQLSDGPLPGSACLVKGTSGSAHFDDGSMANEATTEWLYVTCPVVSTGQGNTIGDSAKEGVYFVDDSPDNLVCTIMAESASYDLFNSLASLSVSNDAAVHRMTGGASGVATFEQGSTHVDCTIPPKDASGHESSIKGIYLTDDGYPDRDYRGYVQLPGTNCRKVGTDGTLEFASDGSVYNSNTTPLELDCPIPTGMGDNPNNVGATIASTRVWYLDNSGNYNMDCTLRVEDGTYMNQLSQWSGTPSTAYRAMNFYGSNTVAALPDGFAHYRCTLPGGGTNLRLVSYSWVLG